MAMIQTQERVERTDVEGASFSQRTLEAIAEARRISRDPNVKGYTDMDELKAALEE